MSLKINLKNGLTVVELLLVLGVFALLIAIVLSTFLDFRKNEALLMDSETVVSILRQARNETLSSKNSLNYGVHFTAPKVVLFVGPTYTAGASTNQEFVLSSTDTILTISLNGGGSDVIFDRLTGETSQYGSVIVSSPGLSETKTVTIYKTGLVEM